MVLTQKVKKRLTVKIVKFIWSLLKSSTKVLRITAYSYFFQALSVDCGKVNLLQNLKAFHSYFVYIFIFHF